MPRRDTHDHLETWLDEGYTSAYRTAYLILRNRADAEDAVQEAFLRAWRFRSAVPEGDGLRPWLYRVVVNACLSKLRADGARRSRVAAMVVDDNRAWSGPGPDTLVLAGEAASAVLTALELLPEHLRIVVVLRYYAGLSEREIATAIHRRPGTVKSRLHEARGRLGSDPGLTALVTPEEANT
jgi:RNA polymerase sigma-70 factor (ECF subfamily)